MAAGAVNLHKLPLHGKSQPTFVGLVGQQSHCGGRKRPQLLAFDRKYGPFASSGAAKSWQSHACSNIAIVPTDADDQLDAE